MRCNDLKMLLLLPILILFSCNKTENKVYDYLNNAELQYESDIQKENITIALNDILTLSADELKLKKYKDYQGMTNQWDLPTLLYKYFVPIDSKTHLGQNFYQNIKTKEVQNKIHEIIVKNHLTNYGSS